MFTEFEKCKHPGFDNEQDHVYSTSNTSSRSPAGYLPGTMPEGWGLRRHVPGKIVVTNKDGSGVLIREDAESVAETLFYRMMDQILLGK